MEIHVKNANEAFELTYRNIDLFGLESKNTRYLKNVSIFISNPMDNIIVNKSRKWNLEYAKYEWDWYLSGNPSGMEIAKRAKIWYSCMDCQGNVNSNYGYQWNRGNQLDYVVKELLENPESRRASISIYDAKDRWNFGNDTPCTYAINFSVNKQNQLDMSVMMRSNDIWYGFCNDQYCFSKLQELVSYRLCKEIGSYHHFANDIHIYNNFLNKEI